MAVLIAATLFLNYYFMKYIITILISLIFINAKAQINKVKNPGFEKYNQCPNTVDDIKFSDYWMSLDSVWSLPDWVNEPFGVPEYCNICAGTNAFSGVPINQNFNHYPRTGNGMAQVQMFFDEVDTSEYYRRDYLQGHLYAPLISGQSYCVTFYTVMEKASVYAINKIGAYFDDGTIDTTHQYGMPQTQYTPQIIETAIIGDSINWTKVQGSFVATGNERLITIGNFTDKAHMSGHVLADTSGAMGNFSWYLIDDISVIGMEANAYAGPDAVITAATDSVWVGDSTGYLPCYWYANGILIDSNTAGLKVHPTATTYYTMVLDVCGRVTSDTAVVWVYPVGIATPRPSPLSPSIWPNPASSLVHIEGAESCTIIVLDMLGRVVINNSGIVIDIGGLAKGVYSIVITDPASGERVVKRVVKE